MTCFFSAIATLLARYVVLQDPKVQADPLLKLRCLVVKGDADLDVNSTLAERDWSEALAVAKSLNQQDWMSRAAGELGAIAFLQGERY